MAEFHNNNIKYRCFIQMQLKFIEIYLLLWSVLRKDSALVIWSTERHWIGLDDQATEGEYWWTLDGQQMVTWNIWDDDNYDGDSTHNCVILNSNRKFDDQGCSGNNTYKSLCMNITCKFVFIKKLLNSKHVPFIWMK